LSTLPILSSLYIANNQITDKSLIPIIKTLSSCKNLIKLDISQNEMSKDGAEFFSEFIASEHCHLIALNMKQMKLDDETACKFIGVS